MNLTDPKHLRKDGPVRSVKIQAVAGELKPGADGKIGGRDKDGNPIRGIIRGKSKARQLREEKEAREKAATAAHVVPETPRERRARERAARAERRAQRGTAKK